MTRLQRAGLVLGIAAALSASAAAAPATVTVDPPRNAAFPASNRQLLIRSAGSDMNALLFKAQGPGLKPTVILLHGLPGNERNLDLAQALRRVGWNVLTFTYRGAWGSDGSFGLANSYEDGEAALAFARSPEGAKLGIDPRRIVIGGHSFGGGVSGVVAARHLELLGLILLDAWNVGADSREVVAGGAEARRQFEAGLDDLGRSLSGATPTSLADEIIAINGRFNLFDETEKLRAMPILEIYATHGGRAANMALVAALKRAGNRRVTAIELNSDHPFADHRIALSKAVAAWLKTLPRR
ncbi:MAG: alpha/beta fold hydrolase [Sphingomicrobium sp.]